MAIFERKIPKTGKTVFDVYVQDWNVHGKRVQKKRRGFESQRSAREAEAKLRAELMLEKGRPERVTWSMWVNRCIEQMKVTRRPSTVINYESTQRTWTVPVLGEQYLDEITSSKIHRLVHEHVQGVTPSSRRSILDQMKRLFGMAVDEGVITRNPATGVAVTVPEPVKTVLRFEEAQRRLREAKTVDHKFYPVWAGPYDGDALGGAVRHTLERCRHGGTANLRSKVLVLEVGLWPNQEPQEPRGADFGFAHAALNRVKAAANSGDAPRRRFRTPSHPCLEGGMASSGPSGLL